MMRKSVKRFSEKIMPKQEAKARFKLIALWQRDWVDHIFGAREV
jgi:hypothetical protein